MNVMKPPEKTTRQRTREVGIVMQTVPLVTRVVAFRLMAVVVLCTLSSCSRNGPDAGTTAVVKEGKANAGEKKEGKEDKEAKLEKGHVKLTDAEVREAGVVAEELKAQSLPSKVTLNAVISANQDRMARLSPRVPARITAVNVNAGDSVRQGQVLALLDSLELGEAQAAWHQAQSGELLARTDFERAQSLHKDEVIAEKDFLRARSEYEKAKAQARAAGERLQLLGVMPSSTGARGASTFPLTAPFAGVVVEKKAVLGEMTQPDKSVFTIVDLSTVWAEASLFEKDLARVRVGASATVTVPAYPGVEFKGKVTHIASMLDKDTRTIPVRITLSNMDSRLKPEMFGTASIEGTTAADVLSLPESAVVLLNGEHTVFIDQDGDYEARHVQLGARLGGNVIIANGVKAGDWVVRKGAFSIKAKLLKSQIGDAD